MIKQIFAGICLLMCLKTFTQNPTIIQQRCFGGSRYEYFGPIKAQTTKDSGYIFIGTTNSEDGDVSGLHNNGLLTPPESDVWVVKLSKYGGIQWQKCLGGSRGDFGSAVDTGKGNTYFVAGEVYSNDGDVSGNHSNLPDGWVVKLNSNGSIIWQKCIGGTRLDEITSLKSTSDGGCIVVGMTYSNDGDVSGNHNINPAEFIPDGWVVKLDANGNVTWSKCYGSTKRDQFHDVLVTADGKYIIAGYTNGTDGDVTGNHPGYGPDISDGWTLKLDAMGNILWKYCYGGNYNDGFTSVAQAPDGGYIFSGYASSNCCEQVQNYHGGNYVTDAWLLKTDAAGGFTWGQCYGGVWSELATSVAAENDGYIFCSQSLLNNGDVQGTPYQRGNIWVAKVSLAGAVIWQRVLGGDKDDEPGCVLPGYDGYPVIFGTTNSINGDVKNLHTPSAQLPGASDIWFAKFTKYNTINLNGFADFNSNNLKEVGEPFFLNYKAEIYKNNSLIETGFSNGDTLHLFVETGSHIVLPLSYNSYYSPVPTSVAANFTNFFNTLNANISFRPTGNFNDLAIKILSVTGNRRGGRTNIYRLSYENVGTTTITIPTIEFIKDVNTSYITSSIVPASILNDTIKYVLGQLAPLTKGFIDVTLKNSTSLFLNDTLKLNATIFPVATEHTPNDNHHQLKEIIIGSYDPNDKIESHGGSISRSDIISGESLHYTIRFQNTGNDTAFFVSIKDTLSSQYDLSSLRMIASSHPYQFEINGNICTWNFYDINLVDSNHNEKASHGFVSFKIKVKNAILSGDIIKNRASIYFDYNPPVQTDNSNTVVKQTTVTSIDPLNPVSFIKMFPNPFTDGKFIVQSSESLKGNIHIEILNGAGVPIKKLYVGKNLNNFIKEVDLRRYPNGNYIVIISAGNIKYQRILFKR